MDEKQLILRCRAGDPHAWRDLVDRFSPILRYRLAAVSRKRGRALPPEDADEILSRVWEDLLRDDRRLLEAYVPGTHLDRWLFTIAVHRMLELGRDKGGREELLDPDPLARLAARIEVELPVQAEERQERIRDALRSLPPPEQFAVRVFYGYGWSHRRIARILRLPVHRIGPLLQSARKRLRRILPDPGRLMIF